MCLNATRVFFAMHVMNVINVMRVRTYVCVFLNVYIYLYMYVHIYICICAYVHMYTHAYI